MTTTLEGTVQWFCNTSGEGMIGCTDGNSYFCHWSAIQGEAPPKNGKDRWAELESGWKVEFSLVRDTTFSQIDKLTILEKCKPRPIPSLFLDKPTMKAKLTAAEAMFAEEFPVDPTNWDEYTKLSRSAKKLSAKQQARLAEIEELQERHKRAIKLHNERKNIVVMSIYREHSKFALLRLQDER